MRRVGKECSGQECVPSKSEHEDRLKELERKLKLIDKQLDEVYETIAPWQIWLDVTTQLEREKNEQLYHGDARLFYPSEGIDRDESSDRESI